VYANRQVGYADEEFSDNAAAIITFLNPPVPQTVLPQDLTVHRRPRRQDTGRRLWQCGLLPDGQITSDFPKSCQAPKSKIFPFAPDPNQMHIQTVPSQERGVAHVINAGRDAVDAGSTLDESC
jgi:hypothetical protein